MKFLDDEEAVKARAQLEKELKNAGEETVELTAEEEKQVLLDFYGLMEYILDYYMDLPKETKNLVILWTIGTYYHKEFNTYPYLFLNAMRSSGKTRLLKIIETFCYKGQLTMSLTESVLFRTVGTLLLDEFEGINRKGADNLRELLNSAYKKGTKIFRMKKKKTMEGESQVVEEFQPYRPIAIANIYGMEEVLGDRCINLHIEKSSDSSKTMLVEDFSDFQSIKSIKKRLENVISVGSCSVCRSGNIHSNWNKYVKEHYYTQSYIHTYSTLSYTTLHSDEVKIKENELLLKGKDIFFKDDKEFFTKVFNSKIDGRHLELFLPLFIIADMISKEVLDFTLSTASMIVSEKRVDEITESKDVSVYSLVASQTPNVYYDISSLVSILRMTMGGVNTEYITNEWMGRALKRLHLILKKNRTNKGIQVILDVDKAKEKEKMFNG